MVKDFARLDLWRRDRTGVPEAVFSENKTSDQTAAILEKLAQKSGVALATRVSATVAACVRRKVRGRLALDYNATARTLVARKITPLRSKHSTVPRFDSCIAILAAGTADVAVAEEARVTAELMEVEVLRFYDVGIAGIHRLAEPLKKIQEANVSCIVAVAGMEGALPSVVRGLVRVPVIGVPVSTGYGYGGGGEAALKTMLQSCTPGLVVVNIDNGFGAGATAALIAKQSGKARC